MISQNNLAPPGLPVKMTSNGFQLNAPRPAEIKEQGQIIVTFNQDSMQAKRASEARLLQSK